ncbi:hypothetical protein FB451DRAFT_1279367, partial [Mycena latifolia]
MPSLSEPQDLADAAPRLVRAVEAWHTEKDEIAFISLLWVFPHSCAPSVCHAIRTINLQSPARTASSSSRAGRLRLQAHRGHGHKFPGSFDLSLPSSACRGFRTPRGLTRPLGPSRSFSCACRRLGIIPQMVLCKSARVDPSPWNARFESSAILRMVPSRRSKITMRI